LDAFFKDLKVVELASVLAGPAVGLFFAELGAEVLKIENKRTGGDVTRSWRLPGEDPAAPGSAYYAAVNWHKTVWMCDLNEAGDRDRVLEAIRGADIVISNFRKDAAISMGVDYTALSQLNPRLIFGQITGFGDDDPQPAFDVVLQAEAGFMFMSGHPGQEPVKMPVALIDLLAAHQLKEGLLLALLRRERSGQGAYVSVSLIESAIASLANQATNWLVAGHIPQPMGSRHPNIAPYGDVFVGADGKRLVLAVGNDRQFAALCQVLGVPELANHPNFAGNTDRVSHRESLCAALSPLIQAQTSSALTQAFQSAGVPCGVIRNMQEVFEHPIARAMLLEETDEEGRITLRPKTAVFKLQ
jgi:crotonobetainyl-CoA:carnitine CoA-transferase CaiB-like acyl-CoA transferase